MEILGEVETFRGRCSGLPHDPHGKLGLRMGGKVSDVTYACSVHMYQCINVMNYSKI